MSTTDFNQFSAKAKRNAERFLGKKFAQPLSLEQLKQDDRLNFEPIKKAWRNPVTLEESAEHFAVLRSDNNTVIGNVGKDYTPVSHLESFARMELLAGTKLEFSHCTVLGDGAKIYLSARTPENDFYVCGRDEHKTYITFKASHGGHFLDTTMQSIIRQVCSNGMITTEILAALSYKKQTKVHERLAKIDTLAAFKADNMSLKEKLETFAHRQLTNALWKEYLEKLGIKEGKAKKNGEARRNFLAEEITALYESNDCNAFPEFRGTAFAALQAVTDFVTHGENDEGNERYSIESKISTHGTGNKLVQTATKALESMLIHMPYKYF